ncbi:MAG: Cytochrome c class [Gemmatimonadetes bacterium]|nr:Cytochrome c class [Gemmatimonadota bacterium]
MAAKRRNAFVVLLGSLLGLLALVLGGAWASANSKLHQHYTVPQALLTAVDPTPTPALLAHGRSVAVADGCTHCHGDNMGGKDLGETKMLGTVPASNLTRGGPARTVAQWALGVRHGIRRDGTSLINMPSEVFVDMSDEDLGAIIAYANSLPPVTTPVPERSIDFKGHLILAMNMLPMAAADTRHDVKPAVIPPGVSVERGRYRTRLCTICHASDLGGLSPGFSLSPGSNLTPSGDLGGWTEAGFVHTMRTGETPSGRKLDANHMPWPTFKDLSDEDMRSIWAYLHSLPPSTRQQPKAGAKAAARPAA